MSQIPAGGFPQNQAPAPMQYAGGEPSMQFSPAQAIQMAQAQAQQGQPAPQAQQPNVTPQTQGLQMNSQTYAQMGNPQVQNQPQPGLQQPQFQPPQYQQVPQTQPLPQAPQQNLGQQPLNQRIPAGPGVPAELVGRTMGEVMQMYGSLRGAVAQQAPQPQAQAPQNQQQPGRPQGQPNAQGANFWANPQEMIRQAVQQTAQEMQAPQLIERAASGVMNLPRDSELDNAILGHLQGLDNVTLSNPRTWEIAYNSALGERVRSGRAAPQAQAQQQPQAQQAAQPGFNQLNSGQQYAPASGQFFTESPTGVSNPSAPQLNQQQQRVARMFNMTDQQYVAFGGLQNGGR